MSDKEKPHYSGHRTRLRERFLKAVNNKSAAIFPDYEILELLLFASHPRGDVKPLAKRLMSHFGTIDKVFSASTLELQKVEGMGDAAISAIKIAPVAAQKMLRSKLENRNLLTSWDAVLDYCKIAMGREKIEQFRVFFLDIKNHLIEDVVMQEGTVDHTQVYIREIIKKALDLSASSLILAHNHPTGDAKPSRQDIEMTKQIKHAAIAVNIKILDHIIIGKNSHYSFASYDLI